MSLYQPSANRKTITVENYTIQDWILGIRSPEDYVSNKQFDDKGNVGVKLLAQVMILQSTILPFDSILLNFKQLTLADMFDSELDGARELLKSGCRHESGDVYDLVETKED